MFGRLFIRSLSWNEAFDFDLEEVFQFSFELVGFGEEELGIEGKDWQRESRL
jgi:hypothetical protein